MKCTATSQNGKPCRNSAMHGAELCASHLGRSRGPDPMITTELVDTLVAMLRAGNLIPVAARAAGVSRSTLYDWLDKSHAPNATALLVELRERVDKARAEGQVRLVAEISKAASNDWRAAAWLLARGYPDEWAQVRSSEDMTPEPVNVTQAPTAFAEVDELARRRRARE